VIRGHRDQREAEANRDSEESEVSATVSDTVSVRGERGK